MGNNADTSKNPPSEGKFTVWPNAFTFGIKYGDIIISYNACGHIPHIDKRRPVVDNIVAKMNS